MLLTFIRYLIIIIIVTEDSRETVFLFQRLSIALEWGNAISFLSTFTATD